jgi:(p)ppGpp synthase/HD superfamily hydrolase
MRDDCANRVMVSALASPDGLRGRIGLSSVFLSWRQAMAILTDRFDRAILYASQVHGGQTRKGTEVPYLAHLMAVAATVMEYGGDEDQIIAALLHDAVEDQGGRARLADIRGRFGERVAELVAGCSDNLDDDGGSGDARPPWRERKSRYLKHLNTTPEEILLIALADKTHNARSILRDLRKKCVGNAIWERFGKPKSETMWYYQSLVAAFQDRLPGQLADELGEIVEALDG